MDPELLKVISNLVMIVAVPVLTVLAGYLAKLIRAKIAQLEAELGEKNPELMYWLDWGADLAVGAAESSGLNGYIDDKKNYAITLLEKLLANKGFEIDLDILEAAIEKAWLDAYGQEKLAAANK